MRLVFLGSGAFGLPTLTSLAKHHEVVLVVTQPDRPAGRHRHLTPTAVAAFAADHHLPVIKPETINDPRVVDHVRSLRADAWVVIAFGQKLGQRLLDGVFAINLHASLLPKYRGAAPINWAIINGELETGVSVIALADRMDAGDIFVMTSTAIDPHETAGELHDRLAMLGPDAINRVLDAHSRGGAISQPQDERLASHAPKLRKSDGTVRFDQPAVAVRNRIHGLTPWPGCTVKVGSAPLRLVRARVSETRLHGDAGTILADQSIACQDGAIELLEVQPPGGTIMTWQAYRNGHAVVAGTKLQPMNSESLA